MNRTYTESCCQYGPTNHPGLLSVQADPKTLKGKGYLTGISYMSPYKGIFGTGVNLCVFAVLACIKACISHTGRGRADTLTSPIHRARETRRNLFLNDRELYFTLLRLEVGSLVKKATRLGLKPCIRMNGTTDIIWETYPRFVAIQADFPSVVFYDYTKIPTGSRAKFKGHLTFSWTGTNDKDCAQAIANGHNIAIPYHGKLPAYDTIGGHRLKVIDGDLSDLRFLDRGPEAKPVVVGLRIKAISTKRKEQDNTPIFGKHGANMATATGKIRLAMA